MDHLGPDLLRLSKRVAQAGGGGRCGWWMDTVSLRWWPGGPWCLASFSSQPSSLSASSAPPLSPRRKASAGRKLLQANSRFATTSRCLGHGIADVWSSSGRFRYQSSSTFPVWKEKKRNLVDPIGCISTRVLMGRQVLTGPI